MSTERLAKFTTETKYRNIPRKAVDVAKKAVLDYLGVAIAGSQEPAVTILSQQVRQMGAVGEAGVILGGFKTTADLAAWVNGTISHSLDYDDTFSTAAGYNMHPSVPIWPAVFALGEKHRVSGKDLLAAYIIGIEVESRIGVAIGKQNSDAGWHPTAVLGTIAAAAASASILNLDVWQTQMALGIASSLASGLVRNFGTMTKPMHAGNAARNGVIAAQLARSGFTANGNIMEDEFSFCNLFSAGKVDQLGNAAADLGAVWHIVEKGLAFKPYPSCRATHASIDAVLHLRQELNIGADQVAAVACITSPKVDQFLKFPQPKNGYQGKFSMQYCVATALAKGKVTLDDFNDAQLADATVQQLLPRINVVHPPEWATVSSLIQEVEIKLKNGKKYTRKVTAPKGDPDNPLTDAELLAKFTDCARLMLKTGALKKTRDLILRIEELKDVTELTEVLTGSRK